MNQPFKIIKQQSSQVCDPWEKGHIYMSSKLQHRKVAWTKKQCSCWVWEIKIRAKGYWDNGNFQDKILEKSMPYREVSPDICRDVHLSLWINTHLHDYKTARLHEAWWRIVTTTVRWMKEGLSDHLILRDTEVFINYNNII